MLSGLMRRNAFGTNSPVAAVPVVLPGSDTCAALSTAKMPSVKPAPVTDITLRKVRRSIGVDSSLPACRRNEFIVRSSTQVLRRFFDRRADTHVRCATANIAAHGGVDIRITRLLLLGEQRGSRHDLSRLAIAALRNVDFLPGSAAPSRVLSPSIVVMSAPCLIAESGVWHERTGCPSTCTVHAPHSAIPQPYLVPVRLRLLCRIHNSGVSVGTSGLISTRSLLTNRIGIKGSGKDESKANWGESQW